MQALTIVSQNPGYMGKHFTLGYGYNVSPSFVGANPNNRFWNQQHAVYIEATTAERWQIGVEARRYKTIYDNKLQLSDENVSPENTYSINGLTCLINFKHYKRSYLAPWGPYFVFGPAINIVSSKYDPYMYIKSVTVNLRDTLVSDFGLATQRYVWYDFNLGWGQSRIFKNVICLDYGMNFQLASMIAIITDSFTGTFQSITRQNYIERTSKIRMHGMSRFNLFIKLGYLF